MHSYIRIATCALIILAVTATAGVGQQIAATREPQQTTAVVPPTHYEAEVVGRGTRRWWPSGELEVTVPAHHMAVVEVTRFPTRTEADDQQRRAAADLVRRARDIVKKRGWENFARASAEGFQLMYADTLHYANVEYILDDRILDPERPEFLLYYDTARGKKLAGLMFLTATDSERGPQIGGPLTVWHYHVWPHARCMLNRLLLVGDPRPDNSCLIGEPMTRSPEMLHVWFIDHPDGVFATDMHLSPELIQQLERR